MLKIPNQIMKPARYAGIEPHSVVKDIKDVQVRFALCYPDIYEIGMSYFGHFLLYEISNNIEDVWCERCFAPWVDMEEHLKRQGAALFTLESKTPLHEMDIVGFSLTYELNITNVLNMLDLGGIRIKAGERDKGPIVIGGGPLMLNPRQYEPFFDIIVIGEADELIVKILKAARLLKGLPRYDMIEELSRFEGVYSPLFPKTKVRREIVRNLNGSYHPVRPPIPTVDSVHNRLNIEISRGCGNGCRFCMAGFGYRPYRERSFEAVKEIIDRSLAQTGYEELSLLSLSSGDYGALFDVIEYVRERYKGVSLSLPSLKIGSVSEKEISAIGSIARTGFTFALEAATGELRTRLNKNIDVELLIRQLPLLKKCGWRRLKLYMMVGFPWETEDDLLAVQDIAAPFRKEGMDVNLSVSPFIPKPHTPFQWLPMEEEAILQEKIMLLKRILKGKGVKVSYRDTRVSIMEGLISRGDERLASLFEYVFHKGIRLEAWREFCSPEAYTAWFEENSIDMKGYLGERKTDQVLPWSFIDMGFITDFLSSECVQAHNALRTVDCYDGCAGCGLSCADRQTAKKTAPDSLNISSRRCQNSASEVLQEEKACEKSQVIRTNERGKKYTIRYTKCGDARYIGHIDTMNIMLRALRSAGVRINMHGKYHPLPKIALSNALPMGVESVCELIEIEVAPDILLDNSISKKICGGLPVGMKIREVIEGTLKDMLKDYRYLLITGMDVGSEFALWKKNREKYFYFWSGGRVKDIWIQGKFERIIKIEARRIHGS